MRERERDREREIHLSCLRQVLVKSYGHRYKLSQLLCGLGQVLGECFLLQGSHDLQHTTHGPVELPQH